MSNPASIKGFFAYPAKPSIAEVIKNASKTIQEATGLKLMTWEDCRVGGKIIISEICKAIDESQLFCADLTGLNHNVMFELGYAIARNKRIWIVIDQTLVQTKTDFTTLRILTTVGYSQYCNSAQLLAAFLKEQPWRDLGSTVYEQTVRSAIRGNSGEQLFYLKTRHATEASTAISKAVENAATTMKLQAIVDDPRESSVQSISWYAEHSHLAAAVIVHLTGHDREGADLHNAKYSFVAGLAHGLSKPVLMLAEHSTALAPLDYRDMLKSYGTAAEAEHVLQAWLVPIQAEVKARSGAKQDYLHSVRRAQQLAGLRIGEPVAENEDDRLVNDYFIETSFYKEALAGQSAIFVGRKGAGKSASFLKLSAALEADKRNLVCVIKPQSYELYGIVELMNRYQSMNLKGYAIEAIWRFLIYSEIARAAEAAINSRPSGEIAEVEKDLIALMGRDSGMLRQDFAVRLERCIAELKQKTDSSDISSLEKGRAVISETLHTGLLRTLRTVLVKALSSKRRVAILVDNLDKAWDKQSDINSLSEFLLGLLGTANRVAIDFRNVGLEHITLNVSLAVFIRADIFHRVMQNAREPDKIQYTKLNWNDDEMLIRVIEERFSKAFSVPAKDVWVQYFTATVSGSTARQYFLSRIMKRPRDLIFFVKAAVSTAVNRSHSVVEESDILAAETQYSQFAVDSILVENGISVRDLERIIYEFVGQNAILSEAEIFALLNNCAIANEKHSYVLRHLCDLTFLGIEVNPGEFRFADDFDESRKNAVLAERIAKLQNGSKRYQVHQAFWAFLEIRK